MSFLMWFLLALVVFYIVCKMIAMVFNFKVILVGALVVFLWKYFKK